jgi:hypothetical protein
MSATIPKKLTVSRAVRDALKAVKDSTGTTAFFKTVKRGSKVLEGDPRPAVCYRRKGWISDTNASHDAIVTVASYQINVLIANPGTNSDQCEELYDQVIAKAEEALETINDGEGKKRFRATPVGGADDVAEEQVPECAASLEYEIEFERPRGRP